MDEKRTNKLEETELDGVTGGSLHFPFRKRPPRQGACDSNVHSEVANMEMAKLKIANEPVNTGATENILGIAKAVKR
jgi:hypothetical protein